MELTKKQALVKRLLTKKHISFEEMMVLLDMEGIDYYEKQIDDYLKGQEVGDGVLITTNHTTCLTNEKCYTYKGDVILRSVTAYSQSPDTSSETSVKITELPISGSCGYTVTVPNGTTPLTSVTTSVPKTETLTKN